LLLLDSAAAHFLKERSASPQANGTLANQSSVSERGGAYTTTTTSPIPRPKVSLYSMLMRLTLSSTIAYKISRFQKSKMSVEALKI